MSDLVGNVKGSFSSYTIRLYLTDFSGDSIDCPVGANKPEGTSCIDG